MTDTRLKFGEMLFEWDEEKNKINRKKHGVDFYDAAMVFSDENRIESFDDLHSDEEERWQVIGKVKDILFVVYTERNDSTRLISARKADAYERRMYYAGAESY